jgi:hypothetical protein
MLHSILILHFSRKNIVLVGGDWNHGILGLSHHIGNVIIPTDELTPSFFGLVNHQPTSYELSI